MIKILFVDDEQNVSQGLRRLLRPMRHEWEMFFVSSGREALEMMASNSFDVIVSDMQMPGMDGSQLLNEVINLYPQTVRLIFSGYSQQDMAMRSVTSAHQYLSKPCDPDELKLMVERACALRDLLTEEKLRLIVTQMRSLPSLPSLYLELEKELRSSEISLKRIGEIVTIDPPMTAKLLQIVNSAFFGLRRRISNAEEAVRMLGIDMIVSLAMSIGIFSQFKTKNIKNFSVDNFWSHSLRVGKFAQWLIKSENGKAPEAALTAGLLHDVGKLVLLSNLPEEYDAALQKAQAEKVSIAETEEEVFGASHAKIGGYLLGLWGVPQAIVEAVVFHHQPNECQINEFGVLAAVHVANVLDNQVRTSSFHSAFDIEYLERLGVAHKIESWQNEFRKTM